jgi:N-acetylmuramoyl-L-alanine amidase
MLPYEDSEDHGPFRPWGTAQLSSIPISQVTAANLAESLRKIEIPVRTLTAPLRPLNNVVIAAVAVEVAPPASDVSALTSPDYQQLIAGALANGIFAMRGQLGGAP